MRLKRIRFITLDVGLEYNWDRCFLHWDWQSRSIFQSLLMWVTLYMPCGFVCCVKIYLTNIIKIYWSFEFFTIGVSVRLSDRSLHREEKKNFVKNCPQWGLETRTSGSSGQCLTNWAKQESVGQEISEVSFACFMHHFTCWTLLISRINRAWLYKGHEDSGWQLNVDLAQLVRHWPDDPEVLVSNPTGGNFWQFFLLFPV